MWIAKLVQEKGLSDSIFGSFAKKHKIGFKANLLNHYMDKNKHYFTVRGQIDKPIQDNKIIKELKKDKRIKKIEKTGNQYTILYERTEDLSLFFNKKIIYSEPIIIDETGKTTLTIASWKRKELNQLISQARTKYPLRLISIKRTKLKEITTHTMGDTLTQKQRTAIYLAKQQGYYKIPREIYLTELARIMRISYTSFQSHLRKAEKKIIENSL